MKKAHLILGITLVVVIAMLSSCSVPKDIAYFQDFNPGKSIVVQNPVEIKFKADDEITIMVSSDKKELGWWRPRRWLPLHDRLRWVYSFSDAGQDSCGRIEPSGTSGDNP